MATQGWPASSAPRRSVGGAAEGRPGAGPPPIRIAGPRREPVVPSHRARPAAHASLAAILIITDHGGEGTDHGALTPANQIVPFTIGGGGIEPGEWEGTMMHTDIAPTVIDPLGIMGAPAFEGRSPFALARCC